MVEILRRNGPWWLHQMKIFSALLAFCAGNSPVKVNSPHKGQWRRAMMFYLICPNIQLSKQLGGWRFETPLHPFWRQCYAESRLSYKTIRMAAVGMDISQNGFNGDAFFFTGLFGANFTGHLRIPFSLGNGVLWRWANWGFQRYMASHSINLQCMDADHLSSPAFISSEIPWERYLWPVVVRAS